MDFEAFPARSAGVLHAIVSLLSLFFASLFAWWGILLLGVLVAFVHWRIALAVEAVVSPAYSEGHPLVNLPPELRGDE